MSANIFINFHVHPAKVTEDLDPLCVIFLWRPFNKWQSAIPKGRSRNWIEITQHAHLLLNKKYFDSAGTKGTSSCVSLQL